MTVKKLSQITPSPSNMAATDFLVGVTAANADVLFTGAQIQPAVGRTILTADANYYVATTGNDSNSGSIASPWLTTQHAVKVICSTLDFSGFNVFLNIGGGSFAGFGVYSNAGGGNLFIIGAGSALTTLTEGPNDGVINQGSPVCINQSFGAQLVLDAMKLDPSGVLDADSIAALYSGAVIVLGNLLTGLADLAFVVSKPVAEVLTNCVVFTNGGNYSIVQTGATIQSFLLIQGGAYYDFGAAWTLSGSADTLLDGYASVMDQGQYTNLGGNSFSGSVTGPRFRCIQNSVIDLGTSPSRTYFPGSAVGSIASGGQYSGITDAAPTVVTSGGTTTLNSLNVSDVLVNFNGAVTVQLPPASQQSGFGFTVADIGGFAATHNVTVLPNGAETIDGNASILINSNHGSVNLAPISTGGWYTK